MSQRKTKWKKMVVNVRPDQYAAVERLAGLASTTIADVIRQTLDQNADEIMSAIDHWEKSGGPMKRRQSGIQ